MGVINSSRVRYRPLRVVSGRLNYRHLCVKSTYMEDTGIPGGQRLPKNFMTPWVLLVLKQWNLHGYLILQQLNQMGFTNVDHATLYRELRRLEKEGFVASEWETGESGPARRVYTITDAGEEMLSGWTEVVSGYQRMINGFFDLYSQVFGFVPPSPASEHTDATDEAEVKKEDE